MVMAGVADGLFAGGSVGRAKVPANGLRYNLEEILQSV
jgi:hypothetical protein